MSWSIESGNSHNCVCGAIFYDSDGGACHGICSGKNCNELISNDDMSLPALNNMCQDCYVSMISNDHDKWREFIAGFKKAVFTAVENRASIDEYFELLEDILF